jgi:hypothetical protein
MARANSEGRDRLCRRRTSALPRSDSPARTGSDDRLARGASAALAAGGRQVGRSERTIAPRARRSCDRPSARECFVAKH